MHCVRSGSGVNFSTMVYAHVSQKKHNTAFFFNLGSTGELEHNVMWDGGDACRSRVNVDVVVEDGGRMKRGPDCKYLQNSVQIYELLFERACLLGCDGVDDALGPEHGGQRALDLGHIGGAAGQNNLHLRMRIKVKK